jgi:Ni,Fe-hydrogenase maturation factor
VLFGAAQALYDVTPDMILISVEANQFDAGEGLSPAVTAAVNPAITQALKIISS